MMWNNFQNGIRHMASRALQPLPQSIQDNMNKIDYTNYAPIGGISKAVYRKALDPKVLQSGFNAFEKEAAAYKSGEMKKMAVKKMQQVQQSNNYRGLVQNMAPVFNNVELLKKYLSTIYK